MTVSAILVLLLMLDAGYVAYRQYKRTQPAITWLFIVLYWVILTGKNMCDLFHW